MAKLKPENERKLWRNWMFLKQELDVPTVTDRLIAAGVYTEEHKTTIQNTTPNSKLARAEKFLNILIGRGEKGFEVFCKILREDENDKFGDILEKLEIPKTTEEARLNSAGSTSTNSSQANRKIEDLQLSKSDITNDASTTDVVREREISSNSNNNAVHAASAEEGPINMTTLERELVKIAPTIAELFQKISTTTQNKPVGYNELHSLKEENERLRVTNRALIDKLNGFQKQIIQLQLENKKLRDEKGWFGANETKNELKRKARELDELREKIDQQKSQLNEKERQLNEQLQKIQEIETENERQKLQILNLEMLHSEGVSERTKQQQEIMELREEKDIQKARIEILEEMQKRDDDRLQKLEDRLRMLEQWNSTTTSNSQSSLYRNATRRRSSRIVSPPRATPWMSGVQAGRSHHANVKFQPPPPRGGGQLLPPRAGPGGSKPTEKGWSF